jgi:hypothetical protein
MRRFMIALLAGMLLFIISFFCSGLISGASVTARPASLEATAGSTVDLPIQVQGAAGICAMQMDVVYDATFLAPQTVKRGALLGNGLLESNTDKPGRVKIALVTLDGIKGDGTVAIVGFKVLGQKGKSSALNLENSLAWEGSTHLNVVVNVEAGRITIVDKGGLPWWIWLVAVLILLLVVLIIWRSQANKRRKSA